MSFEVLTFDCYGTLIDWERGIVEACREAAGPAGAASDPQAVIAAYAEIEPGVEAGAYRPYREVLRETGIRLAQRFGWALPGQRQGFLAGSLPHWKPFADTNPALTRLHAMGYRLGILSNVDDDLLAATLRHFSVPFDLLVTAEQVRSYKPAPGHFRVARERIGDSSWLHIAQSYFHDVEPASALGIPVVWINRKGEVAKGAAQPIAQVPDLEQLVAWLVVHDRP